jgi:alanine racemase
MDDPVSRVRLEINLPTLVRNYRRIVAAVAPCEVMAVLKADAYGLGVVPIATALRRAGVRTFAVAELNEALALMTLGYPVLILGTVLPEEIRPAVEAGIQLPLSDLRTAQLISQAAQSTGREAVCHLAVDTGMGRLGLLAESAAETIREILRLPGLRVEGIYSHFPMAYQAAGEFTQSQIARFRELITTLEQAGICFRYRHIANSDAINNFPDSYAAPFNLVRTGINLHGSFDPEGRRALSLEPVLTLKTRLTAVRLLPAGASVGYGMTYRVPRAMRIGTIAAGYADGLPLALSNRSHVLVRGRACPVVGRVSMDYTNVSLEQVPDAACGDEVTCLGGEGPLAVSVDDWAQLKGTHSYEIICSFGRRVQRVYVGEA